MVALLVLSSRTDDVRCEADMGGSGVRFDETSDGWEGDRGVDGLYSGRRRDAAGPWVRSRGPICTGVQASSAKCLYVMAWRAIELQLTPTLTTAKKYVFGNPWPSIRCSLRPFGVCDFLSQSPR